MFVEVCVPSRRYRGHTRHCGTLRKVVRKESFVYGHQQKQLQQQRSRQLSLLYVHNNINV